MTLSQNLLMILHSRTKCRSKVTCAVRQCIEFKTLVKVKRIDPQLIIWKNETLLLCEKS